IAGVEITTEYQAKELHLLGYFVQADCTPLINALERLRQHRFGRFWNMVERLCDAGVSLDDADLQATAATGVLGRRHLAVLLVKSGRAGTVQEAFSRYLHDGSKVSVPKLRLPVAEALALVRQAGGVASWAHPSYDCTRQSLAELRALGLGAVEA